MRGADPARFETLLTWDDLVGMIERGDHPRSLVEFRLARESVMVPPERWLVRSLADNSNKVDMAKILRFMQEGFSLIITPVDPHVPALAALGASIRSRLSEKIKVGVIVTTGSGGAFKLHYDPEDLIILQVEGSKRWQVFGPPVQHPVAGVPMQEPPPEVTPIFDEVLRAGDMLFVPGGNWHHCESGAGRSMHLGIFFTPPTGWNLMRALTQKLLAEELFVTPISRMSDPDSVAALEARVKDRAIELIKGLELRDFLDEWSH